MDEIKHLISKELRDFEHKFADSVKSHVPLLDRIMHYIVKRKGKQIRPMFVFLSAKLFNPEINESTYRAAALVELLHTATLVHDDVVDDEGPGTQVESVLLGPGEAVDVLDEAAQPGGLLPHGPPGAWFGGDDPVLDPFQKAVHSGDRGT